MSQETNPARVKKIALRISIQIQGLDELISKVQAFSESASQLIQETMLDSATENIVAVAKSLAPKKTGQLADSIYAEILENGIAIVADKSYAPYMEFGTAPHEISARNATVLHWTQGGQDFFVRSVHHPGTKPHPFMQPAIEQGLEEMMHDIEAIFQKELS